uniref:Uncharacterized protein LOC105038071 n=1 Tax=Elaeis guineensis var. tenera TaxID=51953 RepID=A0A6I9QR73_ELAGV|nr:uncharacterized protein LOC105038071 [Elaeis guineensis]
MPDWDRVFMGWTRVHGGGSLVVMLGGEVAIMLGDEAGGDVGLGGSGTEVEGCGVSEGSDEVGVLSPKGTGERRLVHIRSVGIAAGGLVLGFLPLVFFLSFFRWCSVGVLPGVSSLFLLEFLVDKGFWLVFYLSSSFSVSRMPCADDRMLLRLRDQDRGQQDRTVVDIDQTVKSQQQQSSKDTYNEQQQQTDAEIQTQEEAVSIVSRYMDKPGKAHWSAVKWILRYIKGTSKLGLIFTAQSNCIVTGFCDSDYACDLDRRRSLTGYVFTLSGCAVSWKATLQSIFALSTTEAEYMALTEAEKEAIWLKGLVQDLDLEQDCLDIHCDSQSALHLARDQMYHERTKQVDVRYHFIRDLVEKGDVRLQKIYTAYNLADMFTKPILAIKFKNFLNLIGISIW